VTAVPPIRREILVDTDPTTAFELFTEGIARWWPLAEFGVFGEGASVAFEDGNIVERSTEGERAVWGTVTRWDPPGDLAFTWHPGRTPDKAGLVEVTFEERAQRTLVSLQHSGWEAFDDPAAARAEYDHGWPVVLDRYLSEIIRPTTGHSWVALMHRPGPATPGGGSVFADPLFAEHVAFLGRMDTAGYLVAAGPLSDVPGEGMTILRLPGEDQLAQATRLATEDDASVAGGLLTVTVRPWQVMFEG
jgi:uncharacterized protein YciI